MSVRVRYTGPTVTTFLDYDEVGPGEEFEVPDERAESFLNHGYIEAVEPTKSAKTKPDKADSKGAAAGSDVTTN